jgi:hypothetical protein
MHRWEDDIKMGLKEKNRRMRQASSGLGEGPVAGFCKHNNEPLGLINSREFQEMLVTTYKITVSQPEAGNQHVMQYNNL